MASVRLKSFQSCHSHTHEYTFRKKGHLIAKRYLERLTSVRSALAATSYIWGNKSFFFLFLFFFCFVWPYGSSMNGRLIHPCESLFERMRRYMTRYSNGTLPMWVEMPSRLIWNIFAHLVFRIMIFR